MFALIKSSLKLDHVGSKGQNLGQILRKKNCVCYRGHLFSPMIMKLGQNVCLDKLSEDFENGSCGIKKTTSLGQIVEAPCVRSIGHIFSPIVLKPDQNVCLDEIASFEMGHVASKTRSLGEM